MKKPEFQLREIRTLISTLGGFTTREENGKTFVRGYAAVFNSMSEDLGVIKKSSTLLSSMKFFKMMFVVY